MKKTISILGCGWLGLALGAQLVKNGYCVKGSNTSLIKQHELKLDGIAPYVVDIGTREHEWSDFLHADVLIVAITSKNSDDFKYLISKIEVSPVKNVIFISSTSVYPMLNQEVSEETPVKDCALADIERLFISNTNFRSTIIRFAGLMGYLRQPGNFFRDRSTIPHPEGYVNFIHRDDCIVMIERIITTDVWGVILNGCANAHPTRRIFYTREMLKVGRDKPLFSEDSSNEYKIVSNRKMKTMLNFTFKYPDLIDYP